MMVLMVSVLIPSLLQMVTMPVLADPVPTLLDIPASSPAGNSGSIPVQQSGTARNLPHLVGTEATQTGLKASFPDGGDGGRPKDALPLEKAHEVSEEPAEDGLKNPPSLPSDEPGETETAGSGGGRAIQPPAIGRAAVRKFRFAAGKENRTASAAEPTVSSWNSTGTRSQSFWTYSSTTPSFSGYVVDADGRSMVLGVEIEHDPSVPAQGSGVIWAWNGTTSAAAGTGVWVHSGAVPAGKLQDGWLIRWRVRGVATGGVAGPWSPWQAGKIDTSKPAVTSWNSTGTLTHGQWIFSNVTPSFSGYVTDSDGRAVVLGVEVEHDPAVPAQGSGVIWAGSGTTSAAAGNGVWLGSGAMPSGRLRDDWSIRWRVRGVATGGVAGPWSAWQAGKIVTSKPTVSSLNSTGTQGESLWTYSNLMPSFSGYVTDPDGRAVVLGVEVEHDPAVPAQGSGVIWEANGTTSAVAGGGVWLSSGAVPAGRLRDGWLIRWRVRGATTGGVTGPWSAWQQARVDTSKPTVSSLNSTGGLGDGEWVYSNVTPSFSGYVTDPDGRAVVLGVEVEHDPAAAGQGSGVIWAGSGTTSAVAGGGVW
ncbi:hypothetical protein, partial [Nonomuraea sp. KM90]|uniref:hypothetical protein n=1 Tax=Nonomuraea sp. KM90 TaxID=3457428 RepID=UPI003FCD25C7